MPDSWSVNQTGEAARRFKNEGLLQGNVLDVGAGPFSGKFRPIFEYFDVPYLALDMEEQSGIDIVQQVPCEKVCLEKAWPIRTLLLMSFLEHHEDPWGVMRWAHDVLAPGGLLMIGVPTCWPLHDWPHDFWRILPDGLHALLKRFEILTFEQEIENDHSTKNQLFAVARKA